MSWRQIRKNNNTIPTLDNHNNSSSSDSGSDDDSSSSDNTVQSPPTFITKNKQAKKAVSKKVAESGNAGIQRQQSTTTTNNMTETESSTMMSSVASTSTTPASPTKKNDANNNTNNKNKKKKQQQQQEATSSANKKKNANKKNTAAADPKKKKLTQDDLLLRQLAIDRGEDPSDDDDDDENENEKANQNNNNKKSKNKNTISEAFDTIESLLTIENKFSSRLYDPRTERISRFGKQSVEKLDVNSAKRFRPSPFVTPNQQHWPPFDVYGAQLRKLTTNSSSSCSSSKQPLQQTKVAEYVVDVSSEESTKAEHSLQNAIDSSDIDSLFAHWRKFSYHLPTLMQVFRTSAMINQEEVSRQSIEMALYTCGVILAAFPETGNYFKNRRLNGRSSPGSAMVLQVLHLGIHQALKKGCGRTAFELCKFLISMDCEDDVECGWSIIDYVAIRASQFDWIQELTRAIEEASTATANLMINNNNNNNNTSYLYTSLAERQRVLPQLTYGPALAFCFQNDSDANPDMCLYEAILPAVRKMPFVAAELAVAVGIPESVESISRLLLEFSSKQNDSQSRITRLYVKRNTELWRTKNLPGLLRRAIDEYVNNDLTSHPEIVENISSMLVNRPVTIVQRHYALDDNEEHIMGEKPQAMPNELLNAGGGNNNNDGGDFVDEHGAAVRGGGGGGAIRLQQRIQLPDETPEYVRDTFLRFEALFGQARPQDLRNNNNNNITLQDLMDHYDQMLKDRVERRKHREASENNNNNNIDNNNNDDDDDDQQQQQTGTGANEAGTTVDDENGNGNALLANAANTMYNFFRTILPDNAAALLSNQARMDKMLLEELKASGIEDPVQKRNEKFEREHPDDMMFESSRKDDDDE